MTDRCEPPPELRGVNGWHWVQYRDDEPQEARWQHEGIWLGIGPGNTQASAEWAHRDGYRYLSPVLTPAEVAALRAERDAAVAALGANLDGIFDRTVELTTLRAEVARLREALEAIVGPDALLDANAEVFGQHAAKRMREQAKAALEPKP